VANFPDRNKRVGDEIVRCKDDFLYFCQKYLKIVNRNSQLVPLIPKPAQLKIIRAIEENRWQMVLKARQLGSSTVISAYFFWCSLFTPNERTLVVAHTREAVRNVFRIYQTFYQNLPPFLQFKTRNSSTNELVFFHGGTIRVSSATSQNFRGATYTNLHCSESAFWKDMQMTIAGLFQTASGNSRIIIETTANGINGFFAMWNDEHSGFGRTFVSWMDEPDYVLDEARSEPSPELIELSEKLELTREQLNWASDCFAIKCANNWATFRQEYACDALSCFIASGEKFFNRSFPMAVFFEGLKEYDEPQKYTATVLGADVASGSPTGDYSSFCVLDVSKPGYPRIVSTWVGRKTPLEFAQLVLEHCQKWDALAAIESNSYGLAVIEYLRNSGYGKLYTTQKHDKMTDTWTDKLGFSTNGKSRPLMLSKLQAAINSKRLNPIDARLQYMMNSFVYSEKGRPDHQHGAHDDIIFATGIALMGEEQAMIETQMKRNMVPGNLKDVLELELRLGKSMKQLVAEGYFVDESEEQYLTTVVHD